MAIQTKSLEAVEHDWFATRSGAPANAPLTQHKFAYFASKGVAQGPLTQMEREWLQSFNSSDSNNPFELWTAACQSQTLTPGKSVNDCKFNFYTGVTAGTNP